ncbi:hypothetical protein TNCV_1333711 [Trichonephila clavipes]|nr:hypothetical protein TNCV_1333711 [Trichonephila clavipes]
MFRLPQKLQIKYPMDSSFYALRVYSSRHKILQLLHAEYARQSQLTGRCQVRVILTSLYKATGDGSRSSNHGQVGMGRYLSLNYFACIGAIYTAGFQRY